MAPHVVAILLSTLALSLSANSAFATPIPASFEYEGTPATASAFNRWGESVAMSADFFVIGSSTYSLTGAAAVYKRDGLNWVEDQLLAPATLSPGDFFGQAVAASDTRIAVGAPGSDISGAENGAVYIFEHDGNDWVLEETLTIPFPGFGSYFGAAVAMDGNRLVVGAPLHMVSGMHQVGRVFVYTHDGSGWTQVAAMTPGGLGADSQFGYSVAIDGDMFVGGAPRTHLGAPNVGLATVYELQSNVWTHVMNVAAPPADREEGMQFGYSVAICEGSVLVGAPFDNHSANPADENKGSAYYFAAGSNWTLPATLTANNAAAGHKFGTAVRLYRSVAVIGAPWANPVSTAAVGTGSVYVYFNAGSGFNQMQQVDVSSLNAGNEFGAAIDYRKGWMLVGTPYRNLINPSRTHAGTSYLFSTPNQSPMSNGIANVNVLEDADPYPVDLWAAFVDFEDEGHEMTYTVEAVSNPNLFDGTPSVDAMTGILTLTFAPDAFGMSAILVRATDTGGLFVEQFFNVDVLPVNDAPIIIALNPAPIAKDSGTVILENWATFVPGPANESDQELLQYTISNLTNPTLFVAEPEIDEEGTLRFEIAEGVIGTATFVLTAQDNGGTDNGGIDTSAPLLITIQVVEPTAKPTAKGGCAHGASTPTSPTSLGLTVLTLLAALTLLAIRRQR